MSILYYDLSVEQNLKQTIIIDDLEDEYGVNFDITGATIKAQVRKYPSSPLVLDFSDRITITPPNTINIVLEAADTANLNAGLYQWDAIITLTSSSQAKISGSFLLSGTNTGAA